MKKLLSVIMFMFVSLCLGVIGFAVYAKNDIKPNNNNNNNAQQLKSVFENNNNNNAHEDNGFHGNNPKRNNNKTSGVSVGFDGSLFSKGYIIRQIKTKIKEQNNAVEKQENYKLSVLFDELEDVESVDDLGNLTGLINTGITQDMINIIWFK